MPLPLSLSPHICILPSEDLVDLLNASSLPSLSHILQSFSPLPQVTTRTISLVSVSHPSFALRFSDLEEIEQASAEDEDQRAARTIDWIGARINKRCPKWIEDLSKSNDTDSYRTPWWDELRRCTEGDHVPSRTEGWNHPVALIYAVSTTAPNPLQAVTALHSRALHLPPWVDTNILRYTLIIHPENSPLSNEEAAALFNAVKKQYGLHSYLLALSLPTTPPPPIPVPALIPRLPPPPSESQPPAQIPSTPLSAAFHPDSSGLHTLRISEKDIQQTARFTREFLVMSLLPWMEKCVVDWNEAFSSTRRLPSRLFSSTRRLFGSPSPSPSASHHLSSSVSSLPSTNQSGVTSPVSPLTQQRRLAEFATILGDLKLAVSVWEALRKDGKGGSDVLPLLLSPSPTLPLHAANAFSGMQLQISDPLPHEQLTALKYAVRWEAGISSSDFLNYPLEGERWLVSAAGSSEEIPSALLVAHAALLSSRKQAKRRAALWYLVAANRLEKCGIKPLTMFFLRRAHELYSNRPIKSLSPSFWESEGRSPLEMYGVDAIMSGIEHPLGRLLYTSGDVAEAVRFFLGLLRGSVAKPWQIAPSSTGGDGSSNFPATDKLFLDDFRVAYAHFKATSSESTQLSDLKMPFAFCVAHQTRMRLADNMQDGELDVWDTLKKQWKTFAKSLPCMQELLVSGKAAVNEVFWIDLVLRNPLDTEVNLANLTLIVQEANENTPTSSPFVEVGVIKEIVLSGKETRTVPISVRSSRAASLVIASAKYDFLSLLPALESLASRGSRLHDTIAHMLQPTYAPDTKIDVDVEDSDSELLVDFVDSVQDEATTFAQSERKELTLRFSNSGSRPIREVWMVVAPEDELWIVDDEKPECRGMGMKEEVIRSNNSIKPDQPLRISIILNPGQSVAVPIQFHAEAIGDQKLNLLFSETDLFRSARLTKHYSVFRLLDISTSSQPYQTGNRLSLVQLELLSLGSADVHLQQVICMSPTWKCLPLVKHDLGILTPLQSSQLWFGASPWDGNTTSHDVFAFVSTKLQDVLHGRAVNNSDPPSIDILCTHFTEPTRSLGEAGTSNLINKCKTSAVTRHLKQSHPHIPRNSLPHIFPLYHPNVVDFVVFWEIPSQKRRGFATVYGLLLGASHAPLEPIIQEAGNSKAQRSLYAETRREKEEVLDAIQNSEWNMEMNPLVLALQGPSTTCHDFTHGLTFRGILEPSKSTVVEPKLWITRPGTYGLGHWSLDTEVLENESDISNETLDHDRVRHRYRQTSLPADGSSFTVSVIQHD
ncbi:hypothetical protein H0H93_011310 [Arthromyces matolae]|nr:hypothetical protein H0H93_011310 [Arthromyces matolae]